MDEGWLGVQDGLLYLLEEFCTSVQRDEVEAEANRRRGIGASQAAPAQPRPAAAGLVDGNARLSRNAHIVGDSDSEDIVHSALSSISGEDDGTEQPTGAAAAVNSEPSQSAAVAVRAVGRGGRGGRGRAVRGGRRRQGDMRLGRSVQEQEQSPQGDHSLTLRSRVTGRPPSAAAGARRPAPSQPRRSTAAARARTRAAQAARRSGNAANQSPPAALQQRPGAVRRGARKQRKKLRRILDPVTLREARSSIVIPTFYRVSLSCHSRELLCFCIPAAESKSSAMLNCLLHCSWMLCKWDP